MVGVVWFVPVVHYPLFARVASERLDLYSEAHSRFTGYVVGPPMLVEPRQLSSSPSLGSKACPSSPL